MNYKKLVAIRKPLFNCEDIAETLNLPLSSAKVLASRYVNAGLLTRIKKNSYILAGSLAKISKEEIFSIANYLQVPSYVSLQTALTYYEITTQIQQSYVESIVLKRSITYQAEGFVFNYSKIDKSLYCGFNREKGFFIAEPEKAFLDCIYLYSLGRYSFDIGAIYLDKLDIQKLREMSLIYPNTTKKLIEKWTT